MSTAIPATSPMGADPRSAGVQEDQDDRRDDRAGGGGGVAGVDRLTAPGCEHRGGSERAGREPENQQRHVEAVKELPRAPAWGPVEELRDDEERAARRNGRGARAASARQPEVWSVQAFPSQ